MKKFFTLAMAACLGMAANAQDTSGWKEGDDVTKLINWKAYDAADEDPAAPVWQGFSYGASGEWEFRPAGVEQITNLQNADANNNEYFMCWGVYNLPPIDVYQEFTMPAGVYTVSVAGCYRHGQDDATLKLWVAGEKTENCFVYVQVGDDNYQTPMQYKFSSKATEAIGATFDNNNWGNEKDYTYIKDGVTYTTWSPQSHCAADWYIENGYFAGNEVQFVVPEGGATVRVGVKKPVAIAQDQIWWNHWTMTYDMPFNDEAKVLVAKKKAYAMIEAATATAYKISDSYQGLGALMNDDIMELEDAYDAAKTLDEVNSVIEALNALELKFKALLEKANVLEKTYDICNGMFQVTDYPGKSALEVVMNKSKDLLYSEELGDDTTIETYVAAADELVKARMEYLNSQEFDPTDGSKDFTHALAFPWWVNQENTGVHDADGYHYPQNVIDALNGTDDGSDSNLETGICSKGEVEAVSSKAGWVNKADAENTWIYVDNWNGWHGGMKACIQKLKGYAGINSDWSDGVGSGPGGMEVFQNLSSLPDGYYTLEGNCWHNANHDGTWGEEQNVNYMFFEDGEGNVLAREYQYKESPGYWNGWGPDQYTVLKTDFVELKGGKARVGYFNHCWFLNSIMELKYYGTEIDYTGIIKKKLDEIAVEEGYLWPGDLITYNEMIAKVVFPIGGKDAYDEAVAVINAANAFKNEAHNVISNFNIPQQYLDIQNNYEDTSDQSSIIDVAWGAVVNLGNGENDSYTDAQTATAIYNKYVEYIAAYEEAVAEYYTDAMKAAIATQIADLKNNYASVETLEKYMGEIATLKNAAIFEQMCADATEANPVDITAKYVKNPTFDEGPKTGWTMAGDPDASCNTYGRQLAENWNRKAFEISQTLYEMPAGTYELSVRACYRAGGSVDQGMIDKTVDGSFPYNAQLFLNANEVNLASVCDNGEGGQGWTDPSFEKFYNGKDAADALKAMGFAADWDNTICVKEGEYAQVAAAWENDEDHKDDFVALQGGLTEMNLEQAGEQYPFDTNVNGKYYPSSMIGFQERIMKSEKAYVNKVQLYLSEPGTIKLGIKKNDGVGNDWVIYDDFQLLYLGKAETEQSKADGITDVNTEGASKAIYNVAGQRVNALQKGINIVGGKKIYVK